MAAIPRRVLAVAGGVAFVLLMVGLGIVAVTVLRHGRQASASPGPSQVVVHSSADASEAANLRAIIRLVQALPAQLAAGDASSLAASARAQYADVRTALPAGATITADAATYQRTGALASIGVTVAAADFAPTPYKVVLVNEDGGWKVLATYPGSAG